MRAVCRIHNDRDPPCMCQCHDLIQRFDHPFIGRRCHHDGSDIRVDLQSLLIFCDRRSLDHADLPYLGIGIDDPALPQPSSMINTFVAAPSHEDASLLRQSGKDCCQVATSRSSDQKIGLFCMIKPCHTFHGF